MDKTQSFVDNSGLGAMHRHTGKRLHDIVSMGIGRSCAESKFLNEYSKTEAQGYKY